MIDKLLLLPIWDKIVLGVIALLLLGGIIFILLFIFSKIKNVKIGDTEINLNDNNEAPIPISKEPSTIEKVEAKQSLLKHPLFLFFESNIGKSFILSNNVTPEDADKDAINTAFLQIKLKIFHQKLKEFVVKFESNEVEIQSILNLVSCCIDGYNDEASNLIIELPNGRLIRGVPKCYLTKFNRWHDPHVKMVQESVLDVLENSIFSKDEKAKMILQIIKIGFILTIEDAKLTLNQLNGDLEAEIKQMLKV